MIHNTIITPLWRLWVLLPRRTSMLHSVLFKQKWWQWKYHQLSKSTVSPSQVTLITEKILLRVAFIKWIDTRMGSVSTTAVSNRDLSSVHVNTTPHSASTLATLTKQAVWPTQTDHSVAGVARGHRSLRRCRPEHSAGLCNGAVIPFQRGQVETNLYQKNVSMAHYHFWSRDTMFAWCVWIGAQQSGLELEQVSACMT